MFMFLLPVNYDVIVYVYDPLAVLLTCYKRYEESVKVCSNPSVVIGIAVNSAGERNLAVSGTFVCSERGDTVSVG